MRNAHGWVLPKKPPLKAWALGLVTAAGLPDSPSSELVVSEYLLLAVYSLMMGKEVSPGIRITENKHR